VDKADRGLRHIQWLANLFLAERHMIKFEIYFKSSVKEPLEIMSIVSETIDSVLALANQALAGRIFVGMVRVA